MIGEVERDRLLALARNITDGLSLESPSEKGDGQSGSSGTPETDDGKSTDQSKTEDGDSQGTSQEQPEEKPSDAETKEEADAV